MVDMGLTMLFMMFVCAVAIGSLLLAALVAFGLIPFIYYVRKTPKANRLAWPKITLIMFVLWIGLSAVISGVGFVYGAGLLTREPAPLAPEEARTLIELPPEAQITKSERGYWAGDFYVEFKLPDTQTPEHWLQRVWELNAPRQNAFQDCEYREETNSVGIFCHGIAHMSIKFDPESGIYRFEHYFES